MYKELLNKYSLISDQIEQDDLKIILQILEETIDNNVPGDVVEFGCYVGTTSLFIQRLLIAKNSAKKFYVYDSFDGLPEKSGEDISPLGIDFKRGELRSTKAQFIQNFRKAGLPVPIIKKGWFHEIEAHEIPKKISFAFLDCDYYKSIRASLGIVGPGLSNGSQIVADDYVNERLPGVKKAIDQWAHNTSKKVTTRSSLAIIE